MQVLHEVEEEEQRRKAKKGSLASLFDKDSNRGLRIDGGNAATPGMRGSAVNGEGQGSNGKSQSGGFVFGFMRVAQPEQSNGSKKRKLLHHRETLDSQRTECSLGFCNGMPEAAAAQLKQRRGT